MFHCYLHGWSSPQQACPICHPVRMWSSSGTGISEIDEKIFGPSKEITADDIEFLDKTIKKKKKKG